MATPAGERLAKLEQKTEDMRNDINNNHHVILTHLDKINEKLDTHFVTKTEFSPIKKLVYGGVTIILTAVGTAIIYLVVS